ncbi:single-stranded DNA-binding protein [Flagellimonas nanhaiensis]|uniref:Single-stranded DNA-binding protein n=1 Tax=Flagellimonas nanhaiensis TaxID=2292706 RepID=A0A371JLS7_9FLAO|nr:single-stranded DNA-binding protein [Allomuricauda nanhaiensis]RDY57937.1 single-stranded DNA-binding protein [Allomuricauda nanhaiensis]
MSNFRNHVQLIGNIGDEPKVTDLESGKKVCRFPLATNEYYKNAKGQKVQDTDWHNIVAWGKTAEIIEKYTHKGSEIGIIGKLKTRTYEGHDGNQRYVTEIVADEVLLLGNKTNGNQKVQSNSDKPKENGPKADENTAKTGTKDDDANTAKDSKTNG